MSKKSGHRLGEMSVLSKYQNMAVVGKCGNGACMNSLDSKFL
jgi:hypothetical protein